MVVYLCWASQVPLLVKSPPANAGDVRDEGLIPGWGRSLGGGLGNPLQYSCLENPMDRGAWQAAVHRVTKSQTRLTQLSMHTCYLEKGLRTAWAVGFSRGCGSESSSKCGNLDGA